MCWLAFGNRLYILGVASQPLALVYWHRYGAEAHLVSTSLTPSLLRRTIHHLRC